MKLCEVYSPDGLLADRVVEADSFLTRFRGLMFRKSLADGEGLLLKNCPAIHCCFMRFTIDVIYLDEQLSIVAIETVKPWRTGGIYKNARHVLELKENAASGLQPGMRLSVKECDGL